MWTRVGVFVLCSAAVAFGQDAPPPPFEAAAGQRQIAQRFVDQRLAVWRERLKLQDWAISVVLTEKLPHGTLGAIDWDKSKRTATIFALDPSAYQAPLDAILDDLELTVVHELVHLDLTALPRGQASRGSEERAVSGIAAALLGLDRKDR